MNELENISSILESIGFALEAEQPHVSGERFLMAKEKFVLVGRRTSDGKRVIVKASAALGGQQDIENEKRARDLLRSISFAHGLLLFPEEYYWGRHGEYLVWIQEFIEQERVFVEHALEEQFFMALKTFEAQEGFHATTYEHLETVKTVFPVLYGREYFGEFARFIGNAKEKIANPELDNLLLEVEKELKKHKKLIDQYCNYLVHTDLVPHNFRVKNGRIYLLDCSPEYRTVHFGNKYEGWARFLNYMVIHNPELDRVLSKYVRENRGGEEYLCLRLMRMYKLGFLIGSYYANSLANTEGDLRELTLARIDFWTKILSYVLRDQPIPSELVNSYKSKRDSLRSEDEKKRQREFAVA